MPRRMYKFFIEYEDRGVPSFLKFAKSIGATTADLDRFRKHRLFDLAYRECQEIRRDYLIDHALDRRFDPSFTKHLLSCEDGQSENDQLSNLVLQLEVKE